MNIIESQQISARWNQQSKRMTTVQKSLDYYNNTYDSYIRNRLKIIYPNNFSKLVQYIRKYPLTNRLVDDISLIFKTKPNMTIQNEVLSQYLRNSNLYTILPTVNRLANLTYKLGLMPRMYNDKLIVDILLPDRCWVQQVKSFPTEISALYYLNDSSQDSMTGHVVNTATKVTMQTIQTVQIGSNGQYKTLLVQQNPYGYIPVVWIQTQAVYDTFWPTKQNPIPQMHQYYVLGKTYQAFALAYQAIATMITKGLDPKAVVPFGPSTWINLPQSMGTGQADAKYITPGTDFASMYQFTDQILSQAAAYAGMSAQSFKKASQYASGYALQLSRIDVLDFNSQQIEMYTNRLSTLISMIIDTINIYTDYNITSDYSVNISLPETKITYSEKLSIWKQQLDLGITTMQNILAQKYPNMSQQEISNIIRMTAVAAKETITNEVVS